MTESLTTSHRYRRYYQNLEPLLKTRQTQAFLMVVMSLVTIAFFGTFAIRPTLKTIATLQRQIEDRSFLNEKLEEKINALILAQEEYQRIASRLPLIYTLLPEKAEFPSLLRRLELLADQNSATISGLQFDPVVLYRESPPEVTTDVVSATPSAPTTTPIYFTLTLNGDYLNLVALLSQLTLIDRLVTIHSVTISKDQSGESRLNLGLTTRAYYYSTK